MSLSVSFNQTTIITEEDDFTDLESTAEKSELVLGRRSVRSIAAFEEADEVHMDNPLQRPRALTFSPWQPSDSPAVLTWKDLTVSTKTTPPKVLLNNVTGSITGGFWAIMGASGGGKTTLLSTLSLRLDSAKMNIVGDMRFNGRIYQKNALKSMSAYVLQDDLLHAELTVGETISYAAQLRLANICDEEERMFREKEVLDLMGINHVRDVIIGDTRKKGISGGERKRVCVAIELLTRPRLVFLDEPTSGLDSSTALNVITALKKLTDTDICTVVCTIHQPQKRIFDLFDNLLLMKQGTIVYQGSCQKSISFLESIGSPCPPGVNPADFLIEVISPTGTSPLLYRQLASY
jgi:ATP-binding cassette subfamily G (WHITE) protein 2